MKTLRLRMPNLFTNTGRMQKKLDQKLMCAPMRRGRCKTWSMDYGLDWTVGLDPWTGLMDCLRTSGVNLNSLGTIWMLLHMCT